MKIKRLLVVGCLFATTRCFTQQQTNTATDTLPATIMVAAGPEYNKPEGFQRRWGRLYRNVWTTPVRLPVALLDTLGGGMSVIKLGGGNQTKSLHLKNANDRRYTLRSVNKTLGKVLPDEFLGTFIEDIVNDKVAMSHPYAAPVVAHLAHHAGVYHTNPVFVYLPHQPALKEYPKLGNDVFLFEQKIDENWDIADNLGNFKDFKGTDKVIDSLLADNRFGADQHQYIRSRLFDMLINDWDRHEDQWEWGKRKVNGRELYVPVPQDRDQAFFKYDGWLLSALFGASGMSYFQPFDEEMRDVKTFNYEQRNLDRFFANQATLADWQYHAKAIQQALTDNVIEQALQQLPKEVYPISAPDIGAKLKGRRNRLLEYATIYYRFIAREVDVPASKQAERIVVERRPDSTIVRLYNRNTPEQPFYHRSFLPGETREVRVYGIGGNDVFTVTGAENNTRVRLIGGPQTDTFQLAYGGVKVYDNRQNIIDAPNGAALRLRNDVDTIHNFRFAHYTYSKAGISPTIFYNDEDFLYVGLGYLTQQHAWRKNPFLYRQRLGVNFSISQAAFSVTYDGLFPNVIGQWDLALRAQWDAVRWTTFFGIGNESAFIPRDIFYYRTRSEQWNGKLGFKRTYGHFKLETNAFYQSVRIIADDNRFSGKELVTLYPNVTRAQHFGGAEFLYNFHVLNDSIVPTKGLLLNGRAAYLANVRDAKRTVGDFSADARWYLPLAGKLSLAIGGGLQTVTGQPEFYQYANIGGAPNLRGYRLTRFWGKTAYYNNNDVRFISKVRSHIFNGKAGLLAFFDNGRVWLPGEESSTIHTSYGGGIILAPFNKIYCEVFYGITGEENLVQLRFFMPIR